MELGVKVKSSEIRSFRQRGSGIAERSESGAAALHLLLLRFFFHDAKVRTFRCGLKKMSKNFSFFCNFFSTPRKIISYQFYQLFF